MAGEADRSIGLIMPFSSAQMKALCLQAQPWTMRNTLKAFFGSAGCVQRCRWGRYNLAAFGNYKDKWREAQCITHPDRGRDLRLEDFVFSIAAPHQFHPNGFLVPSSPFLLTSPSSILCEYNLCFIFLCLLHAIPPPTPTSVHLPIFFLLIWRYGTVHLHFLWWANCSFTSLPAHFNLK